MFPLPEGYFNYEPLNAQRKADCLQYIDSEIDKAILLCHGQGLITWDETKPKDGMRMFKTTIPGSNNHMGLKSTTILPALFDDVMLSLLSETTEDFRSKEMGMNGLEFLDGIVLDVLRPKSASNPHASTTIKWHAIKSPSANVSKNRDYVYVDIVNEYRDGSGKRTGYRLMKSIALPEVPEARDSLQLVRAKAYLLYTFQETTNGDGVEMNVMSLGELGGRLPAMLAQKMLESMVQRGANIGKYLDMKRLKLLPLAHPSSYTPHDKCDNCQVCAKSFSIMRRKYSCVLCGCVFCSACQSEHVLTAHPSSSNDEAKVCMRCLVQARKMRLNVPATSPSTPNLKHTNSLPSSTAHTNRGGSGRATNYSRASTFALPDHFKDDFMPRPSLQSMEEVRLSSSTITSNMSDYLASLYPTLTPSAVTERQSIDVSSIWKKQAQPSTVAVAAPRRSTSNTVPVPTVVPTATHLLTRQKSKEIEDELAAVAAREAISMLHDGTASVKDLSALERRPSLSKNSRSSVVLLDLGTSIPPATTTTTTTTASPSSTVTQGDQLTAFRKDVDDLLLNEENKVKFTMDKISGNLEGITPGLSTVHVAPTAPTITPLLTSPTMEREVEEKRPVNAAKEVREEKEHEDLVEGATSETESSFDDADCDFASFLRNTSHSVAEEDNEEGGVGYNQLPEGWKFIYSKSTNKSYYYNVTTGLTSWTRPQQEEPNYAIL